MEMSKGTAKVILMLLYITAFAIIGLWTIVLAVSDGKTCITVLLYMGVSYIIKALDKAIEAINNDIKRGDSE